MDVIYRLAIDGDRQEKRAWTLFIRVEFPPYEHFWLKHVVPLTTRPNGIVFKNAEVLATERFTDEDVSMAQVHYTVLTHLARAYDARQSRVIDDLAVFVGLSALVAAQDAAFELLERQAHRGTYAVGRVPSKEAANEQGSSEIWPGRPASMEKRPQLFGSAHTLSACPSPVVATPSEVRNTALATCFV